MDIGRVSYYARKIHRLSLIFVVVTGIIQMVTGLAMKYPTFFPFFADGPVRLLHFQTAGWFALAFGIQMLTGITMYLTPWFLKRRSQQKTPLQP